ncbi:MAG: L-arabinose transport system permease protein AraQ [Candidatus Phytoplasma pruni]
MSKIKSFFKNTWEKIQKFKLKHKINFFFIMKFSFLFSVILFLTFPFYVMVITSLKNKADIETNNALMLPQSWEWRNYQEVFRIPNFKFIKYFLNTLLMVIISTTLGTLFAVLAAFALSILNFPLKKTIVALLFIAMMITSETLVLTNFRTIAKLGMVDIGNGASFPLGVTFAMVLPYLVNVVHVFLIMQAFQRVPKELYYTSKIDGTTDWEYLWKILIPITKSSIIVTVIFRTVAAWNAYSWPELVGGQLLTNMIRKTFDGESGIDQLHLQMAVSVLINLPLLLIFIFSKKYIISGENKSGIKG